MIFRVVSSFGGTGTARLLCAAGRGRPHAMDRKMTRAPPAVHCCTVGLAHASRRGVACGALAARALACSACGGAGGSTTVNSLPQPSSERGSTRPPSAATIRSTRARPSPTPGVCLWRTGSSCVKGSKMSRWRSAGMPGPESMTASPVHPQVVRHRYLDAALLRVLDAVADEVGPRAREILAEEPQRAQVLAPDPRAALHLGRAMLAS